MEKIDLFNKKWLPFQYSHIFQIKKGKRAVVEEDEEGKTNFVSSTESNNGISKKVNLEPNNKGNLITINYDGSVGEAFYQDKPFYALDSVNVAYPKFKLNPMIAMFLITLIKKEKHRFSYGRKWNKQRMEKSILMLPVNSKGEPDWDFMESYVKRIYGLNELLKKLKDFQKNKRKNIFLTNREYSVFKIKDIFSIERGKRHKSSDRMKGNIPYYSASQDNNGLTDLISNPLFTDENKLIYTTFGDSYYISNTFTASDEVTILSLKNKELNEYLGLFLVTILRKLKWKYSFGRKAFQNKFTYEKIQLPIDKKGEPDWDFMESYVKNLNYFEMLFFQMSISILTFLIL